jgi:hypothetical protein
LHAKPIDSHFGVLLIALNGLANLLNRIEKDIINDRFLEPAPESFDQIQLRAIGRKIQQAENGLMLARVGLTPRNVFSHCPVQGQRSDYRISSTVFPGKIKR